MMMVMMMMIMMMTMRMMIMVMMVRMMIMVMIIMMMIMVMIMMMMIMVMVMKMMIMVMVIMAMVMRMMIMVMAIDHNIVNFVHDGDSTRWKRTTKRLVQTWWNLKRRSSPDHPRISVRFLFCHHHQRYSHHHHHWVLDHHQRYSHRHHHWVVDHYHLKTKCMVKANVLIITVTTITNTIIDLEIIAIIITVVVIIIIITRRTMNDSASVERKGQKRRQTGNICVGNVARTNPFHSRLHFHFLQLRYITFTFKEISILWI